MFGEFVGLGVGFSSVMMIPVEASAEVYPLLCMTLLNLSAAIAEFSKDVIAAIVFFTDIVYTTLAPVPSNLRVVVIDVTLTTLTALDVRLREAAAANTNAALNPSEAASTAVIPLTVCFALIRIVDITAVGDVLGITDGACVGFWLGL